MTAERVAITAHTFVIAVPSLRASRRFYEDVLGFEVEALAPGWLRYSRDGCRIMAGECADALPPHELGDHSYFAYLTVAGIGRLYERVRAAATEIVKPLRDEPWGMREFGLRTADGHRIMFGESASHAPRLADQAGRLVEQFGQIDIDVFDQLLRGRIAHGMRILDAGCGGGRNLLYLMREGFDVSATDQDAAAVAHVRALARGLAPRLADTQFRVEPVERCSFASASFDVVLSSAVLHFARDDAHFAEMVDAMWRVLRPGGLLFCRLASDIGLTGATPLADGRYALPDGSTRYLVSATRLLDLAETIGAELVDPLKTTVVQDQRSMTTWVVRKSGW